MANGIFILSKYKDELRGDEHLFVVRDLRLDDMSVPHVVTGEQADGFAKNGHYDIEYHGPNSTSRSALAKTAMEDLRKEFGEIAIPKTAAQRITELEQQLAQALAHVPAKKLKELSLEQTGEAEGGSEE